MIVEGRVVGKGHNDRQEEKPPQKEVELPLASKAPSCPRLRPQQS